LRFELGLDAQQRIRYPVCLGSLARFDVAAHGDKPMIGLLDILLKSVDTFARSAPQQDDMTEVLVKRKARP